MSSPGQLGQGYMENSGRQGCFVRHFTVDIKGKVTEEIEELELRQSY